MKWFGVEEKVCSGDFEGIWTLARQVRKSFIEFTRASDLLPDILLRGKLLAELNLELSRVSKFCLIMPDKRDRLGGGVDEQELEAFAATVVCDD